MGKTLNSVLKGGGANIFVDSGIPDTQDLNLKEHFGAAINRLVQARALSQKDTGRLLGIAQSRVSALQNLRMEGFSMERLMHFAITLGYDVVIQLRPRAATRGEGRATVVGSV